MKNPLKYQMKSFTLLFLMATFFMSGFISCERIEEGKKDPEQIKIYGKIQATLTSPPHVPPSVGNRAAAKIHVNLEIIEKEMEMADGTSYLYWTFGGTVPGSFIRLRVGDEVNFTLKNHPNNKLPHNIDLHAVTGPGGGAEASFVAPGHQVTFSFKALKPGLFVYHCAAPPVGMHIANGMYGLILVEPAGGLPPVDKEFYIMQSEFYTDGATGEPGLQNFNIKEAIKENPDYVVFNGSMDALTGPNAIKAEVGETIRLYIGNAGPNLVSSFHIIGEVMDKVYVEGGSAINENVATTLIPAGAASIVEFEVEVPGELILVDHSIFRAFNKGALGVLEVEGRKNPNVFEGTVDEGIYQPNTLTSIDGANVENGLAIGASASSEPTEGNSNIARIELTGNDQMKFSKDEIRIKAGQTVELTFKNLGKMPKNIMGHNFVLLKKGTNLKEFAKAAMAAADNNYVPKNSNQVIAYTPVIGGGEEVTIKFKAPAPGTYTYICSFPGHYVVMQGVLIVE